jgi:hypothetical protein
MQLWILILHRLQMAVTCTGPGVWVEASPCTLEHTLQTLVRNNLVGGQA